jgi:AraC-like DNA-binding protein
VGGAAGRGILYPARLPTFTRLAPPADLAHLVVHFWVPEWSLPPGRVSRQHVIAFPASNLVVEPGLVGLAGPTTRRTHRDLSGTGWAVGALLRPAAVPLLTDDPARTVDRYVPVDAADLLAAVTTAMAGDDPAERRRSEAVTACAAWWRARVTVRTAEADLANRMAELLTTDPRVLTTAAAAERLHVSERTLQRLAARYVGLPPAAMIRRRRLQEAAERLRADPGTPVASVAHELGYSDHAHLTRDFGTVLGFTPSAYRAGAGPPADGPDDPP